MEQEGDEMSSILIKGMEMPKNCKECDFAVVGDIDFEYNFFCKCSKKYCDLDAFGHPIGWDCPIIEIQTPHGKLIDAHELYGAIVDKGQRNERGKYRIGEYWELTGREIREVINAQPPIIEEEGSDT